MTSENSCYILTCHVKLYIYIKKNKDRETEVGKRRDSTKKQIEKKCG